MEFLSVFASVDKDQDLVIHEADLDNYAAEMKYEKAFTQKWLRLFDRNKDGKITFGEFCETLGLDEKIYEEKLREVRKNLAARQQQQQQQPQQQQQQQKSTDTDRANRRNNRLPPKQPQPAPPPPPPPKTEVKENIEPPKVEKLKEPEIDIEEEFVQPQAVQKIHSGLGSKTSPEEVEIEIDDDDPRSVQVEYSDMDPKELEAVKEVLAQEASKSRLSSEPSGEFDRRLMHALDKKLEGGSWQCQSSPELGYKEVNYQEGSMAVLITKEQRRVMLWRPQKAGGMCCCS